LCITCCSTCARDIWYPTDTCSACGDVPQWRSLRGTGRLLAWTVVRRNLGGSLPAPYVTGLVRPDDAPGVNLVSLLGVPPDVSLSCDLPVEVHFETVQPLLGDPFMAPVFYLAGRDVGEVSNADP